MSVGHFFAGASSPREPASASPAGEDARTLSAVAALVKRLFGGQRVDAPESVGVESPARRDLVWHTRLLASSAHGNGRAEHRGGTADRPQRAEHAWRVTPSGGCSGHGAPPRCSATRHDLCPGPFTRTRGVRPPWSDRAGRGWNRRTGDRRAPPSSTGRTLRVWCRSRTGRPTRSNAGSDAPRASGGMSSKSATRRAPKSWRESAPRDR